MNALTHKDLFTLEHYARVRTEFRGKVMAHKENRRLALGEHATLHFEDALTMQYQIQEALRLERIFEPDAIQEELDVYNPLIPDGSNWKATFMIEYGDEGERRVALGKLIGVEHKVWVQVAGFAKIWPIADEDLERTTEEKTSSVHFLRFELAPDMIKAVKSGAAISMGIEHPAYTHSVNPVPEATRASLTQDLA